MRVPVRALLASHAASHHRLAVADCLGDAFLLHENAVVRNIRQLLVALDYSISASPPYPWEQRELLALRDIYRTKVIPYKPNVEPAAWLERECPGVFTLLDLVGCGLRTSALTHEAAHCIAKTAFDADHGGDTFEQLDTPLGVLRVQLTESFANTVEAMGAIATVTDVHAAFYGANAYISLGSSRKHFVALLDALGFEATFAVTLAGFLCANFLWNAATHGAVDGALSVVAPSVRFSSRGVRRSARKIFQFAMKLSPRFRLWTTATFFKREGVTQPLERLLDFDFLDLLEGEESLRAVVVSLGEMCHVGVDALPARLVHAAAHGRR